MRTIYLAIRGLNYTDRAAREVGKNVDFLVQEQQKLRRHAVQLVSAGIMWLAFAGLAVMGIGKIINASAEGRRAMRSLGRATNELLKELSKAFLKVLGPVIKILTSFFRLLSQNETLLQIAAALATVGIALIAVMGITKLMTAGWDFMIGSMILTGAVGFTTANTLTVAFMKLQAAMGPIIMGLLLGAQLAALFGKNAWVLVGILGVLTVAMLAYAWSTHFAAKGMALLTFGASALAGAAAIVATGAFSAPPKYQTGVEYVRRTGTAVVHEGERITPARGREGADEGVSPKAPYVRRSFVINMNNATINTKADKEELKPFIMKAVRDGLDAKV